MKIEHRDGMIAIVIDEVQTVTLTEGEAEELQFLLNKAIYDAKRADEWRS